MSKENVEVVRAGFEAWNTKDMDALRELYDPGIIWRPPEGWPEPGPYAGRDAVMRQLEQLRETWDFDTFELTATSWTLATELPCGSSGVQQATALTRTWR